MERGLAESSGSLNRTGGDRNKGDLSLRKARKRRTTDRSLNNTVVSSYPGFSAFNSPLIIDSTNEKKNTWWWCYANYTISKLVQERGQVQQEVAANRLERKQRAAAFLRLQFNKSMQMLRAGDLEEGGFSKATENQMKSDRDLDDITMFLYRLESDFEDKKRRLEKMLRGFDPSVSP